MTIKKKKRCLKFILFIYLGCAAGLVAGIIAPRSGIEPVLSVVKAWSPNHWTAREFPGVMIIDGK